MTQDSNSPRRETSEPSYNQEINQEIGSNSGNSQTGQAGRDLYQQIGGIHIYLTCGLESLDMPSLEGQARLKNYFKVSWLLLKTLLFWSVKGMSAKYAFPTQLVWDLLVSSLKGQQSPEALWKQINSKVQKTSAYGSHDLQAISPSEDEFKRLNKIESEYRLLANILKIFSESSTERMPELQTAIKVLELKRNYTSLNLGPLKSQFHPELDTLDNLFSDPNQVTLEEMQNLLGSMVYLYSECIPEPTKLSVEDMLRKFSQSRSSRLTQLGEQGSEATYNTLQLLKWIAIQVLEGRNHIPTPIFLVKKGDDANKYHHHPSCPYWQALTFKLERNKLDGVECIYDFDEIPEEFRECDNCKTTKSKA